MLKNSTDGAYEVLVALLQLNGHDRFKKKINVQPFKMPIHSGAGDDANHGLAGKTHVYSFALKPKHQPSRTCNFSRIDNAVSMLISKELLTNHTK